MHLNKLSLHIFSSFISFILLSFSLKLIGLMPPKVTHIRASTKWPGQSLSTPVFCKDIIANIFFLTFSYTVVAQQQESSL